MLRIAKWNDWQAAPLTKIRGKRRENKVAENAPYAMPKVFVASALDGRFVQFAESVGSNAESYFLRTLQYVALHDPFGGTVNVRREAFGPIVLTRAWDVVGKAKGCAVFDALLSTGIGENVPQGAPRTESAGEPYGAPQGEPAGAPDGDASANSGSGAGSGSGSIPPVAPNGGGGSTSSPHEPQAARTPEPLSTSDRYAFEAIYRGMVKSWAQTKPPAVRSRELRATLLTPTPDADGIREFVTTYTPSFAEEVLDARRTASMEANGRRAAGGGRK